MTDFKKMVDKLRDNAIESGSNGIAASFSGAQWIGEGWEVTVSVRTSQKARYDKALLALAESYFSEVTLDNLYEESKNEPEETEVE